MYFHFPDSYDSVDHAIQKKITSVSPVNNLKPGLFWMKLFYSSLSTYIMLNYYLLVNINSNVFCCKLATLTHNKHSQWTVSVQFAWSFHCQALIIRSQSCHLLWEKKAKILYYFGYIQQNYFKVLFRIYYIIIVFKIYHLTCYKIFRRLAIPGTYSVSVWVYKYLSFVHLESTHSQSLFCICNCRFVDCGCWLSSKNIFRTLETELSFV